jgi:Tol biopolymer transport system component
LFLRAWVRSQDGAEWFIYSASRGQVWKLYRVRVTTQGQIEGKPEQLASGTGVISYMVSVSQDGKLVYQTGGVTESILEIPTDSRGQKLGPSFQLPLPEDGNYRSPSVSRDGRWMAYDASIRGKSNIIRLRDLRSGVDQFVDDTGRSPGAGGETSISPDGSKIIFDRNCKSGKWESGQALPCGFMVSAAGEEPEQLCEFCTARGFSSNGSVVLIQKYNKDGGFKPPHRIAAVDLTSRTEKKFLNSSENSVYHAFFSWDDRWVVFKKQLEPQKLQISQSLKAQIMIAPMRNGAPSKEAEWIAVTDGQYNDDKPQFSPDGNTVYFISTRDGYFCIWAQRLDPATKRPVGAPLAYEHFHNSVLRYQPFIDIIDSDLSVASDKILINLPQWSADVWMTQIE